MSLATRSLTAILAVFCLLQYGFGAELQQQVTVLKYVVPIYPAIAKTARITGDLVLSFNVQSDGTISDVQYVSGPKILLQTSLDAIRQWKFQCLSCGYGRPFHHPFTFSFRFDDKLSSQDHSIKYDLPDKLTLSVGPPVLIDTQAQFSAALSGGPDWADLFKGKSVGISLTSDFGGARSHTKQRW